MPKHHSGLQSPCSVRGQKELFAPELTCFIFLISSALCRWTSVNLLTCVYVTSILLIFPISLTITFPLKSRFLFSFFSFFVIPDSWLIIIHLILDHLTFDLPGPCSSGWTCAMNLSGIKYRHNVYNVLSGNETHLHT